MVWIRGRQAPDSDSDSNSNLYHRLSLSRANIQFAIWR